MSLIDPYGTGPASGLGKSMRSGAEAVFKAVKAHDGEALGFVNFEGCITAKVMVAEQVSRGQLYAVADVQGDGQDEAGKLLAALGGMVGTLKGIVAEIQGTAGQIDVGAREISRGNQDLSQRTERQASALQQTAASMEELGVTVQQNADNARRAKELAEGASGVAARGGEVVSAAVQKMQAISASSKKIGEIIGTIEAIAFQTNILAHNAAVEAARAGFAVVASEVRGLARRSAEAATKSSRSSAKA